MRITGSPLRRRPSQAWNVAAACGVIRSCGSAISVSWLMPAARCSKSLASSPGAGLPVSARTCFAARRSSPALSTVTPAKREDAPFRSRRIGLGGGEKLSLMLGHQRADQFLEPRPFDNLVELVEGEIDAVIGDAALREIIGADALGAVARPDLAAPRGRALGIEALPFALIEPGTQDLQRPGLVLVLRFLILLGDDEP